VSGTDFLAEATDELYGSDPARFTERRAALAAQARAAGDRPAARQIAGLRKPTRPAWIINQLVRDDPGVAARLAGLGDDLRAAAAALDGAKIRELSQARRRLIDSLIRQALRQAGEQSPPAALREDLTATFGAALADPEVARELAAGTLLRAVHRADFSAGIPALSLVPPAAGTAHTTQGRPARAARAGTARAPGPSAKAPGARAARPAKAGDTRAAGHEQGAEAARGAGEAAAREARARDAAQAASAEAARAARAERAAEERRRAVADAEQALAGATQAADQAAAAERDQRGQVRALEDQLDEARRQLAGARRRVRETQAARQKAQRALSRLRLAQ
jgi:hypothetical protein